VNNERILLKIYELAFPQKTAKIKYLAKEGDIDEDEDEDQPPSTGTKHRETLDKELDEFISQK
jgi:hypothetical protein